VPPAVTPNPKRVPHRRASEIIHLKACRDKRSGRDSPAWSKKEPQRHPLGIHISGRTPVVSVSRTRPARNRSALAGRCFVARNALRFPDVLMGSVNRPGGTPRVRGTPWGM
jgi:hypothetical protein